MKLNFIYCKSKENIIGRNNELLFHIPQDMKYFKNITSPEYTYGCKNIVIMGYNTWKSIPEKFKPLSDRINIIITKNHFNEDLVVELKKITNTLDEVEITKRSRELAGAAWKRFSNT